MYNRFSKILLDEYFDKHSLVETIIHSYEQFVEKDMQRIVNEEKEVVPSILPPNIENLKIVFKDVKLEKPTVFEADGSKRRLLPMAARLRKLTYSGAVKLNISVVINEVPHENEEVMIGMFPVMLRSKYCHLYGLSKEELIKLFEDPEDPGGYFIINGTERVVVSIEDLAPNRFLVTKDSVTGAYKGRIFSERDQYRIPHTIEKRSDGIYYLSFSMVQRVPLLLVIKALGLTKDEEIVKLIDPQGKFEDLLANIYAFASIQTEQDALEAIAKQIMPTQPKATRIERTKEILKTYLLPNVGNQETDFLWKAYTLTKFWKKFLMIEYGIRDIDDRDHYMNKKLRAVGDSFADLFRYSFRTIVRDMLYNYQRLIKRGKTPMISTLVRHKLFTQKVNTIMGTGTWVGGTRTGVSQRMERLDYLLTLSHLQRVSSPLSNSQENFEARQVHPTHLGRLCPIETPEGTNIGLRKNLTLLSKISRDSEVDEVLKTLEKLGVKIHNGVKKAFEKNMASE